MYAMRMAAFALGLMAAGSAMAQTAQPQATPQPDQQQAVPCGPGMGMGMGMGPGQGMGMGPGQGMGMGMGPGQGMGMGRGMRGGMMAQQGEVTVETVKARLEAKMTRMANPRIKLGEVTQQADGTILATIVTKKENAVVDKFVIDPKNGTRKRVD